MIGLTPSDGDEADASPPTSVPGTRTPRGLDDLMDGLAGTLPAYSRWLIDRLRQFRVTSDLRDTSPSVTREAAHHIERLEAENLLLSHMSRQHARFSPADSLLRRPLPKARN